MIYEQSQVSTLRRGLWVILWLVVIVAILWTLVWLVFLRHSPKKVSTVQDSGTSQDQSQTEKQTPKPSPAPSTPTTPGQSAAKPAPGQLANTGAGNIVIPFAAASVAGGALYYIRLRRKVLS